MNSKILVSFFIFGLLPGCASNLVADRVPASATVHPEYEDSFSCEEHDQKKYQFSALSGFLLGPHQAHFLSPEEKILRPFTSDGCSLSLDKLPGASEEKNWVDCCVIHDTIYWLGGTKNEKEKSDAQLEKCIARKSSNEIGHLYRIFVDEFGGPDSPNTYRWGYGWNYRRPFAPVTESEELQARQIYGVVRGELSEHLFSKTSSLVKTCDTYDVVFHGFTDDDKIIYRYLNGKLLSDQIVEWARTAYFDLEKRKYLVKIKTCKSPLLFTLAQKLSSGIEVRNECPELFAPKPQ